MLPARRRWEASGGRLKQAHGTNGAGVIASHRDRVHSVKAGSQRQRCEPWPPIDRLRKVGIVDRFARAEAVQARPFVVLNLEQLEHRRGLVRTGHELQLSAGVGKQDPHGIGLHDLSRPSRHQLKEPAEVRIVAATASNLDEHLSQTCGRNRHSLSLRQERHYSCRAETPSDPGLHGQGIAMRSVSGVPAAHLGPLRRGGENEVPDRHQSSQAPLPEVS
jgi:hypothetical protein